MTLPTLFFGVLLSSLYGAVFHLWKDGGLPRLFLFLVLSWAGFWIGHLLANQLGWTFVSVGTLHVGLATLGSLAFLAGGYWLSLVQVQRE
ncbi:MAG: hypothetical protein M1281_18895 [Chloroflexi bacterium]|nr:hypothetical protein [Chloroflexota bacterium]